MNFLGIRITRVSRIHTESDLLLSAAHVSIHLQEKGGKILKLAFFLICSCGVSILICALIKENVRQPNKICLYFYKVHGSTVSPMAWP